MEEKENPGAPIMKGTIILVWFVLPTIHLCWIEFRPWHREQSKAMGCFLSKDACVS